MQQHRGREPCHLLPELQGFSGAEGNDECMGVEKRKIVGDEPRKSEGPGSLKLCEQS